MSNLNILNTFCKSGKSNNDILELKKLNNDARFILIKYCEYSILNNIGDINTATNIIKQLVKGKVLPKDVFKHMIKFIPDPTCEELTNKGKNCKSWKYTNGKKHIDCKDYCIKNSEKWVDIFNITELNFQINEKKYKLPIKELLIRGSEEYDHPFVSFENDKFEYSDDRWNCQTFDQEEEEEQTFDQIKNTLVQLFQKGPTSILIRLYHTDIINIKKEYTKDEVSITNFAFLKPYLVECGVYDKQILLQFYIPKSLINNKIK